jgi:CBS domain-containing protein
MPTANDIMSTEVTTAGPETTVVDAAKLMQSKRVGALPVVDDAGHLMGIVTDRDLVVNIIANDGTLDSTIETYGVRSVLTVSPDTELADIEAIMSENQVRRVPVVDGDLLVGMLSTADVAKAAEEARLAALDRAIYS